jgi:DNA end-binding protein Ku
VGEEAFSVIREAMSKSNTRAISRVVLYHRERAVLLEPRDKGMVLWTLRYGDEVRDEAEYFRAIKGKPGPKEKKLLASLIAEHTKRCRSARPPKPPPSVRPTRRPSALP